MEKERIKAHAEAMGHDRQRQIDEMASRITHLRKDGSLLCGIKAMTMPTDHFLIGFDGDGDWFTEDGDVMDGVRKVGTLCPECKLKKEEMQNG